MNNVEKDQLVGFLNFVIGKITDDDVKKELSKILDKVNDDQQLDNYDISYVIDNTFEKVNGPDFNDDDAKKAFVSKTCDEYNESLSNGLSNSDVENEDEEVDEEIDEIDRIEARIDEIAEIEKEFVSINVDLLKNNIPSKIDGFNLSDSEKEEKKNKLASINNGDSLNEFVNDNFGDLAKDELFIELLDNRINKITSEKQDLEKSFEISDDNLNKNSQYLVALGLANKLLADSRDNKNSQEKRDELAKVASDLRINIRNGNIDLVKINELVSKYSIDKGELILNSYKLEKNNVKSFLGKFEAKVDDKKLIERIEEVTTMLKDLSTVKSGDMFGKNATSNLIVKQQEYIDELKELYEKLNYYDNDKLNAIKNAKYTDIDFFVNAFDSLNKEYNELLNYKDVLDRNITRVENNLEKYKNGNEQLPKLEELKSIFCESRDLKNVTSLFNKIEEEIVENLKNDEDFKKLKRKEKLQEISELVDNHNDYSTMMGYPDSLIDKEKLTNELKDKIAKSLKIKKKKKKKIKIENNKKKWHKAILYAAGIAAGFGLNAVAPVLATNGLIVYGVARASLAITKKVGGVIINSMKSHKSGRKVIKAIKSFGNKDKHPYISKVVSGYKKVMKSPKTKVFLNGTKCFLNGMAIGIGVGKVVNNFRSSFGGPSGGYDPPTGDTGGKSLPDKPDTPVVNDPGVPVDTPSDVPSKVEVGQQWNVEDINRGFIDSTRDAGTGRSLQSGKFGGSVIVDDVREFNGKRMVHLISEIDGDGYAWIPEDRILKKGELLKDVVENVKHSR